MNHQRVNGCKNAIKVAVKDFIQARGIQIWRLLEVAFLKLVFYYAIGASDRHKSEFYYRLQTI